MATGSTERADAATERAGLRFRLVHFFYAIALLAAALAAFGPLSAPPFSQNYELYEYITYGSYGLVPAAVLLASWTYVWSRRSRPRGFANLVCLALVLYCLAWWLIPTPVCSRGAANRAECNHHLKQIGLALQSYHGIHGKFPPAYVSDDHGRPMHSWRVLILPYLGHTGLYRRYRFNEPWDGPTNSLLLSQMPDEYRCPSLYSTRSSTTKTSYLAVVGQQTMWPNGGARKIPEVTDGVEGTLMVVEADSWEVNWMEPRDIKFNDAVSLFASRTESRPHPHPGGFNMLYADGHPSFGVYTWPSAWWETMLTVNAGDAPPEAVPSETLEESRWRVMAGKIPYGAFVFLAALPLPWLFLRRQNGAKPSAVNDAESRNRELGAQGHTRSLPK